MPREGMIIYHEFAEGIAAMSDADAGKLLKALLAYSVNGEDATPKGTAAILYPVMRRKVDRDNQKYAELCETRSKAAKTAASARWSQRDEHQDEDEDDLKCVTHANACPTHPNACPTHFDACENMRQMPTETETETITETITKSTEDIYMAKPAKRRLTAKKQTGQLDTTQQERFDRFWAAYPRREKKSAAMAAWQKINPDDSLTDTIVQAVAVAETHDERFRERQYIPHPATWLNGAEWENDYTDAPLKAQPRARPSKYDGIAQFLEVDSNAAQRDSPVNSFDGDALVFLSPPGERA